MNGVSRVLLSLMLVSFFSSFFSIFFHFNHFVNIIPFRWPFLKWDGLISRPNVTVKLFWMMELTSPVIELIADYRAKHTLNMRASQAACVFVTALAKSVHVSSRQTNLCMKKMRCGKGSDWCLWPAGGKRERDRERDRGDFMCTNFFVLGGGEHLQSIQKNVCQLVVLACSPSSSARCRRVI